MPFKPDCADIQVSIDAVDDANRDGEADYAFEGHVDFFGYHPTGRGAFFGGWIAHPWPLGHRPTEVTAQFDETQMSGEALSAFYYREDVAGRGIGFVFFIPAAAAPVQDFTCLQIDSSRASHHVHPTRDVLQLDRQELVEHLDAILSGGEAGSQRRRMRDLLLGNRQSDTASGFIDFYGYYQAAGGWLLCGWALGWPEEQQAERVVLSFEDGDLGGEAVTATYHRHDLSDGARGAVLFVPGGAVQLGSLCSVSFDVGGTRTTLYKAAGTPRLREPELAARLRPLIGQIAPGARRDSLQALLVRQPYNGEDTMAALTAPVFLEIDEAILCGSDGLLLMGWFLAKPGVVRDIRVRCGALAVPLDLRTCLRTERPDVLAAFAATEAFDDARCGFIAYLPRSVVPEGRIYIEVETNRREVAYRTVPRPKLDGIAAIKRLLKGIDLRFADLPRGFDRVLGPAVEALNRGRLARRPARGVVDYGRVPTQPVFSVIVPLYGRLDFIEYQMALLSAHAPNVEVEFIYVLDEPSRRKEAQALFASVHERFLVPFRAVLLDQNVGFAPANNIGLEHAHGTYVAFLNSDVFPGTPDWLARLAARLDANPKLGVVGPQLLFEDGSVQHRGMAFRRLAEFGDWFFPVHEGKGLRSPPAAGLLPCVSITGACMVMRRALAQTIGGFDEVYAIGDFEDSDLCLKLQALGHGCAVDAEVVLYHLERKSQASSALGWRMNLTLYNAWQHERRWTATIAAQQAA